MRKLARLVAAAACLAGPDAAAAKTYGLVIGIDDYQFIPKLEGAVNDARDIAEALGEVDAEVVTLLNRDASRAAILKTWRDMAQRLQDGDRLIVSYAGHGSNEPEHVPGSEEDGRDETLLLSGFAPFGPASAERILDDEIATLIEAAPAGEVIFVADACHSGTLSRDIDPPLGYRFFSYEKITDDALPPPPPHKLPDDAQDALSLFLGAVDDANKVPEFMIDGNARGALSYAFAKGLRGEADLNTDGALTKGEIEEYVRRTVRGISQGLQSPQVRFSGTAGAVVLALPGGATPPPAPAPSTVWDQAFDDLPPVSLISNADLPAGLTGVTPVSDDARADLIYDSGTGTLRSRVGDVVRQLDGTDAAELQAVIDKTRLTKALDGLARATRLTVDFSGGDRDYRAGEVLTVRTEDRSTAFITLFDIASDGQIAYLYPVRIPSSGLNDPLSIAPDQTLDLPLQVAPPFGADHIIAIETAADPAVLRRVLASFNGSRDLRGFWDRLRAAVSQGDDAPALTLFPFVTRAG